MSRVMIDYPQSTLFAHEVPIRISDLNYGNHLGHDTLVSFLHEARVRFFHHHGMAEDNIGGCGIILTDLMVRYHAQAFFGQVLKIELAANELGSRGCDFVYRVTDLETGKLIALARTGILCFDYGRQRVVNVPPRLREVVAGG